MNANRFVPALLAASVVLAIALAAAAQETDPRRVNREQMWPAPTAEDWKKPCLIKWQRTWEDALAVSKETKRPILICVNMDGEIASEHYAGVRYRSPEICALYEPYITVIASVYRHAPRDYDDQGRRVICPRFGSVTCGEHIAIEPIVYEKYLEGQRVAPRHIMIELDGSKKYDVFYRNDTASVFEDIRKGMAEREGQPPVVVRGDKPIVERVASRDVRDREAVEGAYEQGDPALRQSLLDAAQKLGAATPLDLLRLAVFGLDSEMSKAARAALANADSAEATDLISEALRVPMDDAEREKLITALTRLGENSPKARWLAVVHEGLGARTGAVDADAWAKKGGGEYKPPPMDRDMDALESQRGDKERASMETPDDPDALLELAESSLAFALKARRAYPDDADMSKIVARHMFEDARRAAEKAAGLKAPAWRVNTILALVAYYRGEAEEAYARSADAVKDLPPGEAGWNAMAVLTVFAEGRFKAIKKAAREKQPWPPQWLADLDGAYGALLAHPQASDGQVLWYHDFLLWLGAKDRAAKFLRAGLARFPDSPVLHDQLRARILEERGVDGLEAAYEEMLASPARGKDLEWFAAYASYVTAEFRRRAGKGEAAAESYGRAISLYERAAGANPAYKDGADHWIALALAGRARLAYEKGDDDGAVADLVASFTRKPDSAGTKDGLGITPADTARMVLARLVEQQRDELEKTLAAAMAKLDPELVKPKEE